MAKASKVPSLPPPKFPSSKKTDTKNKSPNTVNNPTDYLSAYILLQRAHYHDFQGKPAKSLKDYNAAGEILTLFLQKFPSFPIRELLEQELKLCLRRIAQLELLAQNKNKKASTSTMGEKVLSKADQQKQELRDLILKSPVIPNPKYTWSCAVGLDFVKKILKQVILIPLATPDVLRQSIKYPRNILLFGPPGCGKTLLIKILAAEVRIPVFSVSASDLSSKWHGESQKMIRALFETAWEFSPSIIFIDEFDGIFGTPPPSSGRPRTTSVSSPSEINVQMQKELLQFMDGIHTPSFNQTVTIVATNNPHHLQPAQLRRFNRILYVAPPSQTTVRRLIEHNLRGIPHTLTPDRLKSLSYRLRLHTPSEIQNICGSAYIHMLTKGKRGDSSFNSSTNLSSLSLSFQDIDEVRRDTPPILMLKDINGDILRKYHSFNSRHGNPEIEYIKHGSELPISSSEKIFRQRERCG